MSRALDNVVDPMKFAKWLWPGVTFYKKQREVIYSVAEGNVDTVVPGCNMSGKDFVTAFIVLWFFLSRTPCRVVTTSAKDDHLRVLWGEIGNFIQTASRPLSFKRGGPGRNGPLMVMHQQLLKVVKGQKCELSYVKGMVASPDTIAAMQGHHIAATGDGVPRTLMVFDEASSCPDEYYTMTDSWANLKLILGNTWDCNNFFKHAVYGKPGTNDPGGDITSPRGDRYYRKVIQIRATDSPNIRYALAQLGIEASTSAEAEIALNRLSPEDRAKATGETLVPGVKGWEEYLKNLQMWDEHTKCVCLDAEFYEGKEAKLFPKDWISRAHDIADKIAGTKIKRVARAIGCDPASGGDSSVWCVVDEFGIIEMVSLKTPDTTEVCRITMELMRKYRVPGHKVFMDRGGGGKEHADYMRHRGVKIQTVSFGEKISQDIKGGVNSLSQRREHAEVRSIYNTRRAQMYGMCRGLLNPAHNFRGFGIPRVGKVFAELVRQMRPIPLMYDKEGALIVPPKQRKATGKQTVSDKTIITLDELIGRSPDELDALVLAVYGMLHRPIMTKIGAVG